MQGKYKLIGIIIPFLAIFLMSHNVGAVSPTIDTRLVRSKANTTLGWGGNDCDQPANYLVRVASGKNTCYITSLSFGAGYNEFLAGDIVEVDLFFIHNANDNALNNWIFATIPQIAESPNTSISIIGQELSNAGQNISKVTYYLQIGGYVKTTYETRISLAYQWGSMVLYSGDYLWANVSTWRVKTDDYSSITNSLDDVVEAIQDSAESSSEYQEQEQQAISNIENQTPQDMSQSGSTENAQTSSLLQTVGGLLTALQSMQTGSCSVQLPLPNFAGGSMTVNICQGKDKTGNLVSIFGSVALIVFYIPLAWKLISMIYSEIRSFTNG